jgi:hypothetical protein
MTNQIAPSIDQSLAIVSFDSRGDHYDVVFTLRNQFNFECAAERLKKINPDLSEVAQRLDKLADADYWGVADKGLAKLFGTATYGLVGAVEKVEYYRNNKLNPGPQGQAAVREFSPEGRVTAERTYVDGVMKVKPSSTDTGIRYRRFRG